MDISKLLADPLPESVSSPRPANGSRRSTPATSARVPRDNSSSTIRMQHNQRSRSTTASDKCKRRTCEICGNSFVSRAHLAIHDRTVHQRLKLYQCDICKTSFGQPGTLTRHKAAVHEKRRDHECSYANCGKRFGSRWTLSVHERNVHEKIKPFTCSFPNCDRQFGNLWNQRKHESLIHNIQDHASRSSQNRAQFNRPSRTSYGGGCGPPNTTSAKIHRPSARNSIQDNSSTSRLSHSKIADASGTFYDVRRDFVRKAE